MISALFGAIAVVIIFLATSKYGIGISPDSACYISIAENLNHGNGYAIYDLEPAVAWPPLYPTILAAGDFFGLELSVWGRLLNIFLFGLLVFLAVNWIFKNIIWTPLKWIGAFGILFSPALIYISKYAWSELLFSVLVILTLFQLQRLQKSTNWPNILILTIICALACLARYIGVTLVIFSAFCILLRADTKFVKRVTYAATFSLVSFLPLFFWLLRNFSVSNTLTGPRTESSYSILENVLFSIDSLSSWILPQSLLGYIRGPIAVLVVLALIIYFWITRLNSSRDRKFNCHLPTMFSYSIFYIFCLIFIATAAALGRIDWRFMSPIYIPLLFSIVIMTDFVMANRGLKNKILRKVIFCFSLIWAIYLTANGLSEIRNDINSGAGGYATDQWQNSELADYLSSNPLNGKVYSNFPDAIYALTGQRASIAPRKTYFASNSAPPNDMKEFADEIKKNSSISLVWFKNSVREIVYKPEDLQQSFELSKAKEFSDGVIYELTLKPTGV